MIVSSPISRPILLSAALALLALGCQVGSTGAPGLIDIAACDDCRGAYQECLASGNHGQCEAMMQECFAECSVPEDQPVDCGCDEIYDSCMGDGRGDDECDRDPACGGDDDDRDEGRRWQCEQIYRGCAFACDQPTPPGPCQECDGILEACFDEARRSDDPVGVITACIEPYVECRVSCELGRPGDDEPGDPGSECRACDAGLERCFEEGGDEERCFGGYQECLASCGGSGGGPGACYEAFEECLWRCGDGESRAGCEERLLECLGG
jgi:hypothetical protein